MELVSNKKQFLPYVGPRPFQNNSHDRALFYGRDYESQEIISLILGNSIVLVYSQSGSGKTSLFNAKIYPTLTEQYGFQVFPTALVRGAIPEDLDILKIPNLYIFNTLQSLNPDSGDAKANSMALQNDDFASFLTRYPRLSSDVDDNEGPGLRLIVFDQFEDFFNTFPPNDWLKQQNDFFMQVIKALENDPSLRIVFVMREEYVAQLDPFAYQLPGKLRARFRLEPLRRDAALLAVIQPLKNTGVSFAPGVAEELVDNLTKIHVEDVLHKPIITKGEYVEPVHLQVVCQRLWNKVSQRLTQITHDQLEDVDAALKEFYEEAVHDTAKQTRIRQEVIRDWCENKLITTTGTRSIIHQESSLTGGLSNKAVSILEGKYLIRAENRFGATWIELTHDRLIEPIKESNKVWRRQQIRSKRASHLKVAVPIVLIAIVGISIFAYNAYERSVLQHQQTVVQQQKLILQQQKLILQQQKLVNALVDASRSLVYSGNYSGAIKNLDKALSIDPNNVVALTSKGRAISALNDYNGKEDIKYLDKALTINPNYVPALETKANILWNIGNTTEAKRYIDKALALAGTVNPHDELELTNKASALVFNNATGAITYFDKALAMNPKDVTALHGKGFALDKLGNHTQAIRYFDRALAINPNDKQALNNKGLALDNLGNHTQAIQYYDKVLAIDPKYKDALNNKGLALDNLGNHTQAIQYYDKVLAIDPKYKDALNNKGIVLGNLGNHTQAIQYFDKVLAIDPKYKDALNAKGYALAELGKYNEGLVFIDKALAIDSKNTNVLDSKGFALDGLGRHNEAIVFYNKALAIGPKNTGALVHKGKSLDGLGRHNEAIVFYNKALSIEPKNTDALNGKKQALAALNNQTTFRKSPSNQTTTGR